MEIAARLAVPDPLLHHLGELLRAEMVHAGWGSALMVDSMVRTIAVHLLRRRSNLATISPLHHPALSSRRLGRAVDHMKAHLDQPIRLSERAALCGLSSTHFSRAFHQAAGKPPHAYLIELRLELAIELLEHTRLSITKIALRCGFDQPQYFATLFRRRFGFTPSFWRRERGI